ncbi:MAG: hypothetical protein ACQETX_01325 [Pseudomonadota bacterium]
MEVKLMEYSFSNIISEAVSTCQGPAPGIDQEAVHRIRNQGRIERAKTVRQGFARLKRIAAATHFGGSI